MDKDEEEDEDQGPRTKDQDQNQDSPFTFLPLSPGVRHFRVESLNGREIIEKYSNQE